jgi:hypothetical protein
VMLVISVVVATFVTVLAADLPEDAACAASPPYLPVRVYGPPAAFGV